MDIKEIQKFISSKGIECELKDFFFDSENVLYLHIDGDKTHPIFTISKSEVKSFEDKVKRKFNLKKFNVIFAKKRVILN